MATAKEKEVIKRRLVETFGSALAELFGTSVTKAAAEQALESAFKALLETACQEGLAILPGGYGSFEVKKRVRQTVKDPQGNDVEVGPRPRLVFKAGKTAKAVLGEP